MKIIFLPLIFLFLMDLTSFAQKSPVDHSINDKWPNIDRPKISSDGNYAIYNINNQPVNNSTLVIQSTQNNWKKEFIGASDGAFMKADRQALFKAAGDSLCILTLGIDAASFIANIQSFKIPDQGNSEWFAYQLKGPQKEVVLRNLINGTEHRFFQVNEYLFSNNGKSFLVQANKNKEGVIRHSVQWLGLPEGKAMNIWEGEKAIGFAFDNTGSQLAFIGIETRNGEEINALWYYKAGMQQAEQRANDRSRGINAGLRVSNFPDPKFTNDGRKILFSLTEMKNKPSAKNIARVDVWSYKDETLQSQQLEEFARPKVFAAVIQADSDRVIQLTLENDRIIMDETKINGYVLLASYTGDDLERNWRSSAQPSVYVVSTLDGERTLVKEHLTHLGDIRISPDDKYVVYFDRVRKNYYSYNIVSGKSTNITQQIKVPLFDTEYDWPQQLPPCFGIPAWSVKDNSLFIYDLYDIWKVDLEGGRVPENVTKGYGRKHKIILRFLWEDQSIAGNKEMLLTAFDLTTKYNGFYRMQLGKEEQPERLIMQPCVYYMHYQHFRCENPSIASRASDLLPVKARDNDGCVVQRMSATDYPNLYFTKDFKAFTSLTNLQPQRDYNWLTVELIKWKTYDGIIAEGILHKPENFDPEKKYPVIFYFYEKNSNTINYFNKPEWSGGWLSIPWYVSNGYLVFVPDIHYKLGETGQSIYNSVVSAARHLARQPWVDSTKMGIQGHSMGGYEVNCLITRTNLFAAAAESAGATDLISNYGGLTGGGRSLQFLSDQLSYRIGATLWQKPELHIKNSPVFQIPHVQTPLLIMHNKKDDIVPWQQGVEFFTGLRRLGKRAWMLQYDNHGHQVGNKEGEDYTIRLEQFFGHYLKGAPAPKWMTTGIPARNKGIDMGLTLDQEGTQP